MDFLTVISEIKKHSDPNDREGMARFGINPQYALGVRIPVLRKLAKTIGKNHELALALWDSKIHEVRIFASMIAEAEVTTAKQMDSWVKDFNSWDICDQCCMNLFCKTPFAWKKAQEWVGKEEEFVRRAGFALVAALAVHDKKSDDKTFIQFLPLIHKYAVDERNFVKKAVNWALRQIGKRNQNLNREALKTAHVILKIESKSAKWIAKDAIRELSSKRFK
ncbi:MAG: DNA alkylation repair protein [Candidatus Staskawiczbacteria bacterium]|jgi:3-methyladenine DNA glycosylase AlkD